MNKLTVVATLTSIRLYRLDIYLDDVLIGEYERSQDLRIDRKIKEINNAEDFLIELYEKHGPFVVRWAKKRGLRRGKKSIRVDGVEVGKIPHEYWEKQS